MREFTLPMAALGMIFSIAAHTAEIEIEPAYDPNLACKRVGPEGCEELGICQSWSGSICTSWLPYPPDERGTGANELATVTPTTTSATTTQAEAAYRTGTIQLLSASAVGTNGVVNVATGIAGIESQNGVKVLQKGLAEIEQAWSIKESADQSLRQADSLRSVAAGAAHVPVEIRSAQIILEQNNARNALLDFEKKTNIDGERLVRVLLSNRNSVGALQGILSEELGEKVLLASQVRGDENFYATNEMNVSKTSKRLKPARGPASESTRSQLRAQQPEVAQKDSVQSSDGTFRLEEMESPFADLESQAEEELNSLTIFDVVHARYRRISERWDSK